MASTTFEVELEGPLDLASSLAIFRRSGDDMIDRFDGACAVRTTRREKTFTTAGAAFFTTGAKERWMSSRLVGTAGVCAAAGSAAISRAQAPTRRTLLGSRCP